MAFLFDGFLLMLVGMGMVFLFLVVMMGWIWLSSVFSRRFSHLLPDDIKPAPRRAAPKVSTQVGTFPGQPSFAAVGNPALAAAISAAVQAYRRDRGLS